MIVKFIDHARDVKRAPRMRDWPHLKPAAGALTSRMPRAASVMAALEFRRGQQSSSRMREDSHSRPDQIASGMA
jgi:hypothetical protein